MDGQTSDFFFFEWLAKVRDWSLYLVSFLVGLRTYQHPGIKMHGTTVKISSNLYEVYKGQINCNSDTRIHYDQMCNRNVTLKMVVLTF